MTMFEKINLYITCFHNSFQIQYEVLSTTAINAVCGTGAKEIDKMQL